jgi:phosphoglycolate phosphatase-like HAD superfamily hydrolase
VRSGPSKATPGIVVVDLDGPILDTRRRHHACYAHILGEIGCAPLDLKTYWRLKRRRTGVEQVLARSRCVATSPSGFERRWLRLIEQPSFLAFDVVQPGALETLRGWNELGFHLVLASMRRNRKSAREQVRKLGIAEMFQSIRFSSPDSGPRGKAASVTSVIPRDSSDKVWVGDTEADVMAAKIAGFRSIAVSCGIRSRRLLLELEPDLVVPRLASIRAGQLA